MQPANHRIRRIVLFACGAILGLLIGFYAFVEVRDSLPFAAGLMAFGIAGGLLSSRLGARFLEMIGRLHWIPWL